MGGGCLKFWVCWCLLVGVCAVLLYFDELGLCWVWVLRLMFVVLRFVAVIAVLLVFRWVILFWICCLVLVVCYVVCLFFLVRAMYY